MSFYGITGVHCTYPIISAFLIIMFDPKKNTTVIGNFRHFQVAKEEANYKLCRVKKVMRGPRGIPYAVTHDGRTVRYPDPDVKAHDTVRRGAVKSSPISYGFMGIEEQAIEPSEMVVSWEPNGGLMIKNIKMSSCHIIHIWDEHPSTTALWGVKSQGIPLGELTNQFLQVKLGDGQDLRSCEV